MTASPDPNLAVEVKNLDFDFGGPPILKDLSLCLPKGSRCLLVGANGAGKSTLLKILGGKRLVKGHAYIFGKSAFYDAPPGVTYLGTEWAGNPIVRRDVPVTRLLKSLGAERHAERCAHLLEIMDVDPNWHMHEVSDGERRRVQIVLGLMEQWDVLLLDEVTVDLDVLVRARLLEFLYSETENRGATILYATHIFDGLGGFPTHVAHIRDGHINVLRVVKDGFPELEEERNKGLKDGIAIDNSPLLRVVEKWLREDYAEKRKQLHATGPQGKPKTKWDIL
ncbi:CCR4-NOT regulatory complex component, partial [Quaeritorhiza haematococci]